MPFDAAKADRVCAFFSMLKHTDGKFYGKPFKLLPWEEKILRDVYGTVKEDGTRQYRYIWVEVPKKNGKALAIDTLIPTPQGWRQLGDLQIGDQVFDELGKPCNILATTGIMTGRPCYRMQFENGQTIIADAEHQWLTTTRRPEAKTAIRTTHQIAASVKSLNGLNHRIDLAKAISTPEQDLPLTPYLLGLWLGDGNSRDSRITIADPEPLSYLRELGYEVEHRESFGKYGYWVKGINPVLRDLGLFVNKHIPEMYIFSSIEQRLELLRGLMDSDGYCSKRGQCEFSNTNERLANDVVVLARSLGFKATITTGRAMLYGKDCGEKYRVLFHPNSDTPIFRIQRDIERQSETAGKNTRSCRIYIKSCKPIESVPVKCIEVDSPSRLYLASESFIPTHNSELGAGVALYHLYADGEINGEVYGCAADRDQASIIYDVASKMLELVPALLKRSKILPSYKKITDKVSGTRYKVMSSEAYTKHGYKPSAVLFDEIHAQPNRELWDVMTHGAGASRAQPIWWNFTTAGKDPDRVSIGWELHDYAMKVASGEIYDPSWYVAIYSYEGDDIFNEEHWYEANPSLGEAKDIESMRDAANRAKNSPEVELNFRWLDLNQWVTTKLTSWIDLGIYDQTEETIPEEKLLGLKCYLGQDASTTTDLSSIVRLFPPQAWLDHWHFKVDAFLPRSTLLERVRTDHVPYDKWESGGYLHVTEGDTIDHWAILDQVLKYKEMHEVVELVSDPAFAVMLTQAEMKEGVNVVTQQGTFAILTDPMNTVETLMRSGKLTHEHNPLLRWTFGNASIATNGSGLKKLVKETKGKSVIRTKRIDPVMALVLAMCRARFWNQEDNLEERILSEGWGM